MFVNPLPSAEVLRDLFRYDAETGILTRAADGKVMGSSNGHYLQLYMDGRKYLVHRVIWKMVTGSEPLQIDHEDLNKMNNRWLNLRSATKTQNEANRPARKDNRLGCKGVSLTKSGKFCVRIFDGQKWWCRTFASLDEARSAHLNKSIALFGDFARAA